MIGPDVFGVVEESAAARLAADRLIAKVQAGDVSDLQLSEWMEETIRAGFPFSPRPDGALSHDYFKFQLVSLCLAFRGRLKAEGRDNLKKLLIRYRGELREQVLRKVD